MAGSFNSSVPPEKRVSVSEGSVREAVLILDGLAGFLAARSSRSGDEFSGEAKNVESASAELNAAVSKVAIEEDRQYSNEDWLKKLQYLLD
jgi:hypothetical protein